MKLSVIIPAYNEAATLAALVERVQAVQLPGIDKEIIVVDDGSKDRTGEVLRGLAGIRVIRHARNAGKGAALATGIRAATGDIVIFQDADLEYDPGDYRTVIQPILDKQCEAVMGSRFLMERPVFFGKRRSPYLTHYLGNLLIVAVTNRLYGQRFTDYEGCYKAFARKVLTDTPVSAKGFEFDNELICKILRKGIRMVEVPIRYVPRTYARGKKITWRHGLIMLWTIVKWRVRPFPRHQAWLIGLIALCAWLACSWPAAAQHGPAEHRRPPDVKQYLEQLDRPERDQYQKPEQVVQALGLKAGMAVADLGSGSGYFTRRFVKTVTGTGKVYAIDVEQEMLTYTKTGIEQLHIPYTAEFILAKPDDPMLPADSVDLIFLCNVYHHLEHREKYFARVKPALKSGGRVAVVDFYHDKRSGDVGFPRRHLVARETVVAEMGKAGYRLLREHAFLPRQYFLEFVPITP